mgnify:CR=1 FL=1
MHSDIFCKVYNEFGWNYYPEVFGEQLLQWLKEQHLTPKTAMDLACGTGVLCRILEEHGIRAAGMDLSPGMIQIAREASPHIPYEVADMVTFCPEARYDLVTCTGDAVNHIPVLADVERIFANVFRFLSPGGHFVFDLLRESEVSDSEPFEMDWEEHKRVWFQMTRPGADKVNLKIRVYQGDKLALEENIRETLRDPAVIVRMLENTGFRVLRCADCLPETALPGTTWFLVAQKPL